MRRATCSLPHMRHLDPVVDGVAHQVQERIAQRVENGPIDLDLAAHQHKLDLFSLGRRHVARRAFEVRHALLERDHPKPFDRLVQRRSLVGDHAAIRIRPLG